jgi:hypothetical protein
MNLRREVSNALVARGFRREGRMHLLRVDENFSLWVDTGPLGERSDIAPFVGVRHDGVEQQVSELLGLSADDWVGTVGANVGYVLGDEYKSWEPPRELEEVLRTIDSALERLRPLLSLDKLPRAWEIKGAKDPSWRYREIVILLLRGERQSALDRLDAARAEMCQQKDEICEQFQAFAQRVQARLG